MISAAKGAETFYTLENHSSRSEDLETARMLDTKAAEAWVGHPNVDSVRRSNKKYKTNVTIYLAYLLITSLTLFVFLF